MILNKFIIGLMFVCSCMAIPEPMPEPGNVNVNVDVDVDVGVQRPSSWPSTGWCDCPCCCDFWSYHNRCGQYEWPKYPLLGDRNSYCPKFCAGNKQSPINIENPTKQAYVPFTFMNYNKAPDSHKCINDGHHVDCIWNSKVNEVPVISGGNLPAGNKYIFHKLDFHIGCQDGTGSEHTVDGKSYSAALHLYHYNDMYTTLKDAYNSGAWDAVAILVIFLHVDGTTKDNPVYSEIVAKLPQIKTPSCCKHKCDCPCVSDTSITFGFKKTLDDFLPKKREFYRYSGSIAYPACQEVAIWSIFKEPSSMSKNQISMFRDMEFGPPACGYKMCNNKRHIQPLNGRKVISYP